MNAANPASANPIAASTMDERPREPSMEEILASIRRIIADDQSLPGRGLPLPPAGAPAPSQNPMPLQHAAPFHDPALSQDSVPQPPQPVPAEPHELRTAEAAFDSQWSREFEPPPPAIVAEEPPPIARTASVDPGRQHGAVAAPQFATPAGPVDPAFHVAQHGPASEPYFEPAPDLAGSTEMYAVRESVIQNLADEPVSAEPHDLSYEHDAAAEHYDSSLEPAHDDEPAEAAGLFSEATDTSLQSAFNMLAATRLADNSEELKSMVREMIRPLLRSWLDDNLPSMVERMVRAEIERVARGGR